VEEEGTRTLLTAVREVVFSIPHERTINGDNTIALDNRILQIEKTRWRDAG
jgi:hypothetical protein